MNTQRTRIQAFLTGVAFEGNFFAVTYDPNTGLPRDVDLEGQIIKPVACHCNEVNAQFIPDENQGRRLARRRDGWMFELRIDFDREVTAEVFEQFMLDACPKLPPTDTMPGIIFALTSVEAEHPVQQEPTTGSKFKYLVEAVEGRR